MSLRTANINVMVAAARKAGRVIARDYGEVSALQVSVKGVSDFVTAADRKVEEILREELMRARPAYGWLGEETGAITGADETRRWIVDPIDGTTNFIHGLPHFAISIGLEYKGDIVAGVVFDPVKNELFAAEKGEGAWMNDRRIRVSARREMSECIFATGVPFGAKKTLPATLRDLGRLMPVCAGVRRWGSAALDLAYVAAGRYDGFWERELQPWDMAAGVVLVREAGGMISDLRNGKDMLGRGSVIAANAEVFEKFRDTLTGE